MNQTTFSFPQIVNRTLKKIELSTENQSINECLGILLRTRKGELLGNPQYGCYLIDRVFRYQGVIIEQLIKEDIIDAVTTWEPRIEMTTNDIEMYQDGRTLHIFLQYVIKETGEVNDYNLDITPDDSPYKS